MRQASEPKESPHSSDTLTSYENFARRCRPQLAGDVEDVVRFPFEMEAEGENKQGARQAEERVLTTKVKM